jgi:hypothetical protein
MKKILALVLFAIGCVCASAQVHTLELGSRGKLTFYLLGDWKVNETSMAGQYSLTIQHPKESVNTECKIEVSFPETDRFARKDKLKLQVEADCRAYEEQSVEGKAYAKELSLGIPGAYGFYCSFTDPSLRGKPTKAGDFKVISAGKIRVNPEVLVDVFIGGESFSSEAYNQLLGAIEGMEFSAGRRR